MSQADQPCCLASRKETSTPFSVNLMRGQVLYRAAQGLVRMGIVNKCLLGRPVSLLTCMPCIDGKIAALLSARLMSTSSCKTLVQSFVFCKCTQLAYVHFSCVCNASTRHWPGTAGRPENRCSPVCCCNQDWEQCSCSSVILGPQFRSKASQHLLQLFEYILEYLRTVRFGEPDHSLALPADQTELAQIVREVST